MLRVYGTCSHSPWWTNMYVCMYKNIRSVCICMYISILYIHVVVLSLLLWLFHISFFLSPSVCVCVYVYGHSLFVCLFWICRHCSTRFPHTYLHFFSFLFVFSIRVLLFYNFYSIRKSNTFFLSLLVVVSTSPISDRVHSDVCLCVYISISFQMSISSGTSELLAAAAAAFASMRLK